MLKNSLNYPVEFVEDVFGEGHILEAMIRKISAAENPRLFLVADINVVNHLPGLGQKIGRWVQSHGFELAAKPAVIAGGEKAKADNFRTALTVISELLTAQLRCEDVVLVLGGGSLMDVVSYASPQVRGGVKTLRIPTTPAAMLEAAFANYGALDSVNVKDALRIPCEPDGVVIDTTFATSVMDGVWKGGFGEAVRIAAAQDKSMFKLLQKYASGYSERSLPALGEIIDAAFAVRKKKGSTDFALWSVKRLEAVNGFKLPYGYLVPIGISIDTAYAVERGLMKAADRDSVLELLKVCGSDNGYRKIPQLNGYKEAMLPGLDGWSYAERKDTITLIDGIGSKTSEVPDREVYARVIERLARG